MTECKERIIKQNVSELSREYINIFATNLAIGRVTPAVIDGLKPVSRRALYTMFQSGVKEVQKVGTVANTVMGKYHSHGDSSLLTNIALNGQWWNNNIPLIDTCGTNYGTIAGDVAGAGRYIKAKLSDYAYHCFFADWKESNVDMKTSMADERLKEPVYLPSRYPNVLINGSLGIGVGMSSNLPPYNFKEVCEAVIRLMKDPMAKIELIPDSPTGCSICGGNFKKIFEEGTGVYSMRATYTIDPVKNTIHIDSVPYQTTTNTIKERIADIKMAKGMPEIINFNDASGREVDMTVYLKNDVNPYRYVKKLFETVGGLQKSYPVSVTVVDDFRSQDMSIRQVLLEWIKYRREQRIVMVNNRRTSLQSEERTNDVKIFLMSKNNLNDTINLFRNSRNRAEIEQKLIEKYRNSEIRMDSLQAKAISDMRFYELTKESYEKCLARREELIAELKAVNAILQSEDGIDQLIIAELRDGIKRFGCPRKSKIVPWDIEKTPMVQESCILQLSASGMIHKYISTDLSEEPIPVDADGFAVRVDSDMAFAVVDQKGYYSLVKVEDLPVDSKVPINRYLKNPIGIIAALLPYKQTSEAHATLISKKGIITKFRIGDMKQSKRPCIGLDDDDIIVKGLVGKDKSVHTDILIFTSNGYGQRIASDDIRFTSPSARGLSGVKLMEDDEVVGCYRITKDDEFICYVTTKGKMRLNKSSYLPNRKSKNDAMVRMIKLVERDRLVAVIGASILDKVEVFFDDQSSEVVPINQMKISTMSGEPTKMTKKSAVSNVITKVKKIS